MKGKYKVIVRNNKLHYEFEIKRNITIIQGDSATGKTTLINMLRQAENLGESSGVDVLSNVPCRILEGVSWKLILQNTAGTIFFIDEENAFINTEEFASEVRGSDNYFVLITRENLYNLPYSVEEIYGLYASGRYQNTKKIYQQMYRIYSDIQEFPIKPELFIVEDSNSGYEFFKAISDEKNLECESAGGKSNIFSKIKNVKNREVCVIADGAAIGPEMNGLYEISHKKKNIHLYLPESFEWIVLKSGLIDDREIRKILETPELFIDSKKYFSWERFFTNLLIEKTKNSYLQYRKSAINKTYLHSKNKEKILNCIEAIQW
ncbi:MAG: translation initiation factor 2 [Ruminococcus sp.]|uniref:translation initiation factor 2 n=1 Tax=Blautia sp. MSJ-9 TaxID=2841511 RepID=UPI001C11677F|nr:translation initiation factor 2 [Blautia sp. MSJ-9]MBS4907521.1 translation initiation factor 2 [Ruminococcus sp.]MBU5681965.1 translation initiation factor 2 [Blautia sp. MSJ-9]